MAIIALTALFQLTMVPAYGQERLVSGVVTGLDGKPIPGVNVSVKGTAMGSVSDKDGRYALRVTPDAILVFSFVGMETLEFNSQDQTAIDVVTEKETCQLLFTTSIDDGKTWSGAVNMTRIKKPEWPLFALSPTNGITLEDGTLVFPAKVPANVALTYSKDGGKTWEVSNLGPKTNGAENVIVQLNDGSIMLNARAMGNSSFRTVYTTPDLGRTWIEHPTNSKVLIEPGCHASLYKHTYMDNGEKKSILFFSNPDSGKKRERMTLKASFDEGMMWPEKYWILPDEGRSAYSSLTSVDDQTIGILYEGSQAHMTFQKIALSEFLKKE